MNKLLASIFIAMLLLSMAVGTLSATSGAGQLPFKGSMQAVENDKFVLPTIYVQASGSGNATHLGLYTVQYEGTIHRVNGVGIGVLTAQYVAANGDRLFARASGQGVPSGIPGVNKIVEQYTITGGTGRFAGATGSFTQERLLTLATGVTSGTFDGVIVIP